MTRTRRPSLGDIRRYIQPWVIRLWLRKSGTRIRRTRVAGFDLEIAPSVFHPRRFGSSAILGSFLETLDLEGKDCLDMGTGSGVLGLIAVRKGARVTAVDVNPVAVDCAVLNAKRNGLSMEVLSADLFDGVDERTFDYVVWNLPFFAADPENAAEQAFWAGSHFDLVVRFSRDLGRHLNPYGTFYGIVSSDTDFDTIFGIFEDENFEVEQVASRRWGLGETMIVFRCRKQLPDRR